MKMDPIRKLLEEAELRKFIDGYADDPQHRNVTIVMLRSSNDDEPTQTASAAGTPRH